MTPQSQHRNASKLAAANSVASPGAEHLRSQRPWQGLISGIRGSDGDGGEGSTMADEGQSGVVGDYSVGEDYGRLWQTLEMQ